MTKWYEETTDVDDVVISSRIRLARNLKNLRFAERMSKEESNVLFQAVKDCTALLREKENTKYLKYKMF